MYKYNIPSEYKYHLKNAHDKIFRDLLNDRKEVTLFLNKTLKLHKDIKENEIEPYNTNFITKDYKNRQSDIVYKLKNKNIFFLIEHQSKIDYLMIYRILEYSMEVIRNTINTSNESLNKFKYPKIIPIVIYTGNKKWNAEKVLSKINEKLATYKREDINIKYNLVDINEYEKEELIQNSTSLSIVMAIEKCTTRSELVDVLEKIISLKNNNRTKEKITRILKYILIDILGNDETKRLIEELNKEEEEFDMLIENLMETDKKLIEQGVKQGEKNSVMNIIKNMIKLR